MSYTNLTKTELVFIEEYHNFGLSSRKIAKKLERGHEAIYRVIRQLKQGLKAIDVYRQYKKNKSNCGRKRIVLPPDEKKYIKKKVSKGWTPDVIIGRKEKPISCSMRTLYRRFSEGEFNQQSLSMQGKRKPNGHQEKCGRQSFRRTIKVREKDHPNFENEFGHLEGDTIIGRHHKSAVITLVERKSKCIIAIKPAGRQAVHIETSLNNWLNRLPKEMDFNPVSQEYISKVAKRRNHIPRKSLGYLTPIEYFMKHVDQKFDEDILSRLI